MVEAGCRGPRAVMGGHRPQRSLGTVHPPNREHGTLLSADSVLLPKPHAPAQAQRAPFEGGNWPTWHQLRAPQEVPLTPCHRPALAFVRDVPCQGHARDISLTTQSPQEQQVLGTDALRGGGQSSPHWPRLLVGRLPLWRCGWKSGFFGWETGCGVGYSPL